MVVNMMGRENSREIVNGKLLQQFKGKKISLIGAVENVNPNGLSFEIKTTDDQIVKVMSRTPQTGIIEGYVEVHGISQGNSVACDRIIQFGEEQADLDVTTHNSLCMLLHSIPRLWEF